MQEFWDLYEKIGSDATARAVFVGAGILREPVTVRRWRQLRAVPDYVETQMPAILRAMHAEADRAKGD